MGWTCLLEALGKSSWTLELKFQGFVSGVGKLRRELNGESTRWSR